jgi:hypothetical protein
MVPGAPVRSCGLAGVVLVGLTAVACHKSPPVVRYDDFVTLGGSFASAGSPPPVLVASGGRGGFFNVALSGAPAYCAWGTVHYSDGGPAGRTCNTDGRVDPAAGDAWALRIRTQCHVDLVQDSKSWTYREKAVPWTIQVGVDFFGPRMGTYVSVNRSNCEGECAEWADKIWKCITDLAR